MNSKTYRLVYSRVRNMVVPVAETASAAGKSAGGGTHADRRTRVPQLAHAVMTLVGVLPTLATAQIVPNAGTNTEVIQTRNGLPQVNVAAPSNAGVSLNTYHQFDVQRAGAILNNSPAMVNTQQAGMINGNPHYAPGQSARIIVNQVNSANPSQIRGYIEVAGNRAEVILANQAGIVVDGGGFINTSRATLTTGRPYYGADGSLAGIAVSRGRLVVQGAGFNAANVDQVDLIARAVQANAAMHAKTLSVITGANQVDRATHVTKAIAGESEGVRDDAAPRVAIDVGQLGGMYADRILLVGTEHGVGVNNAGVLAAQAGDLILQSNGRLVLSGKTHASGNLSLTTQDGIDNNGTTYARQGMLVRTAGSLANSGLLAARQNLDAMAGSIDSTGTLGAGVSQEGSVDHDGELSVIATDNLTAIGQNLSGGNGKLQGRSLSLTNSQTAAKGSLTLLASAGDLMLTGARTSAQAKLTATASGTIVNDDGDMSSQGAVTLTADHISNRNAKVSARDALNVRSSGEVRNQGGALVSESVLELHAIAVANNRGTIQSAGAMAVKSDSLDNTAGRVVSLNSDGLSITATGQLKNAAGTTATGALGGMIASNGDVMLNAHSVVNSGGARIFAGRDLTLNIAQQLDNTKAVLSAVRNMTLNGEGARIISRSGTMRANGLLALTAASTDNTHGTIGNDVGSAGNVSLSPGLLINQGGAIGSDRDLSIRASSLTGDGSIVAGRNADISLDGDYTHTAANKLHANANLTLTAGGELTNRGKLSANGALVVNAANFRNQLDAGLNSAETTINAHGGRIDNAGRIEGGTVVANSATLNNTGVIVGRKISVHADLISNVGAAAVIAAADQVNLYASGCLSNIEGASIFSAGNIQIAANGQRDANGLLAQRVLTVLNDQSSIEAQGAIELAAEDFTNTRTAPVVETETISSVTKHETKRGDYLGCATGNPARDQGCSRAIWSGPYKTPQTSTFAKDLIVSESNGERAVERRLMVKVLDKLVPIYYNTLTDNGNGTVTVIFWMGYDPHIHYPPASEYPTRSDGHRGYQRVEIARDTTTTISQDKVRSETVPARFLAGGNLVMQNVGTINNAYSMIAAGGTIKIGDADVSGKVGVGSYGGTRVNNIGQTLYRYQRDDIVSLYAWNGDFGRDRGTIVQPPRVYTPVAVGDTGGTITAGQSIKIDAKDVQNRDVAAERSVTGGKGSTDPGLRQNVVKSGQLALPRIELPVSGLYKLYPTPGQPDLIVTDPRLTSHKHFISSDYMLAQLGLNPAATGKRLGDGMYEQRMVRDQVTRLTGRVFLLGYASAEDEYRALMTSGATYAKQYELVPGIALSAAQMDTLTSDMVWLVKQTVSLPDGSTAEVLAPVVYLAKARANDLRPLGALIAADDLAIRASGSVTNSGVIHASTKTVVSATDIVNRGGAITSSGANGTTVVAASKNVLNASGQIGGNQVAVLAGQDIVNKTLVDDAGVNGVAGVSKVSSSLLGQQGRIAATGNLLTHAGRDLTMHGAGLSSTGNARVTAGRDIHADSVQSTGKQSMHLNDQRHWEEFRTAHVASGIGAGGDLVMQSGNDTTLKGTTVLAGKDLSVTAGGDLTATTVTNEHRFDNVALDDSTRQEISHTYNQETVGTTFTAGRNVILGAVNTSDASKGNIMLTASSVTSGANLATPGGVRMVASNHVTIKEGRERHDSYRNVQAKRGSVVSGSTTKEANETRANISVASTVSGDTVSIQAGKDLTVQGAHIVGTKDVKLDAAGNVAIKTSQDVQQSASSYEKKESGLMSNGGLSVSVGTRSMSDKQQHASVTHNGSAIGSLNGDLTIHAGNDVRATASLLGAGNDLSVTGKTIKIDAAQDTMNQAQQQQFRQAGLTVSVTNPIVAAVQTGRQMASAARNVGGDARLTALAAATTGLAAKNAYDSVGGDPMTAAKTIGVNVSVGASKSDSQSRAQSSTAVGSRVVAGRHVTMTASGAGKESRLDVIGSTVAAGGDAKLTADGNVNLQAAQNTRSQHSTNSGASAGVGVSFVGSSMAFTGQVSGSRGHADGETTSWTNTQVSAGNQLTLRSGGDTTLQGALASGKQVRADVGGNLNVESLQNTDRYDSKQQSAGLSGSFGAGQASVSGNLGQTKIKSDYASVVEQSGIRAGDGGFQIKVVGNTDLKGAVIASSDKAVQDQVNRLTTGTLTQSDIENRAEYKASQVALSGGYGGPIGKDQKGRADNVNPVAGTTLPSTGGISVAPPVALGASGDADSTTRSAVSGGIVSITDEMEQQEKTGKSSAETIASLKRDTSNADGALAPIFDKDKIEAGFEITGQFVNQVGSFVDNRAKEADAAQKAAKDLTLTPAQRAQAQEQADQLTAQWGPGGSYRRALTALSAAAGGNVTGGAGQFAVNAAVNYFQGLAVSQVKRIADELQSETARAALHAIVGCAGAAASGQGCGAGAMGAAASSVLGSLMGAGKGLSAQEKEAQTNLVTSLVAAVAGAAGNSAATAANAAMTEGRYNRQLDPNEYALAKKHSKIVSDKLGITLEQAEGRIVAEMLRNSDKQTAEASGGKHDYEVRSIVGCQNLNCGASKNDPKYADHEHNREHIKGNQRAYDFGQQQLGAGATYDELVKSNIRKDPVGSAVAGAGLIGLGAVTGGPLASAGMAGVGAAIGMGANGTVQLATGQKLDWKSLVLAGATGAASTGMKFAPGLFINTGGALIGSALAGQNPNGAMVGAAVGTAIGYPIGSRIESSLSNVLNPWYRQKWKDVGLGMSVHVPQSPIPSWIGEIVSNGFQESASGALQNGGNGKNAIKD